MALKLFIDKVSDQLVRQALQSIQSYLNTMPVQQGSLKLLTIPVVMTAASTTLSFPHGLSYTPKDAFVTSVIGSGAVQWNYSSFDQTNVNLTVTGGTAGQTVTIRAFVGSLS